MPALLDLKIHFDFGLHCEGVDARDWDCAVLVDFSTLPKLSSLTISHLSLGNLIFHGKSESVKTLEIIQSESELSDKLSDILREIEAGLEQIIVTDSWARCRALNVELSSIKKVHLYKSTGFFPFLLMNKLPALEEITWEHPFWSEPRLFKELKAIRSNFPNNKSDWASIIQLTNSNGSLTLFLDLARRHLIDPFKRIIG
ncbi:uncharacterized protein BDW43DRAFT_308089 [Aspergillus alliaceus]|uniref:uncharacterized protein n=1 Tax=Petromyces alliaceus TaxID=209559 RepID=UPI0012A41B26|nr:uncharacterized protein BDW43DRAFT_308089 [Aspergillus alliaceus]KAB8236406.1 hypothetical protein BDW43DRAFT_308089 [Aspergillus alliaceus]